MAKKTDANIVFACVLAGFVCGECTRTEEPVILSSPSEKMSVSLPESNPSVRFSVKGRNIVDSNGNIKKLRGLYTRAEWLSSEQEVEMFRNWEVNFVRILLTHDPNYWQMVNNGIKDINKRGILREENLRHMDQRVAWLERNEIYFLMEIHWRALGADDNLQEPELLGKQFAEMYKLLATRYSRSNYLMGFCTFSEIHLLPCRYNDYNQIRKVIIDAVHKVDRLYIISLTGTWWSSPGSLNDKIYIDRPNIIYDFHFYSPKYFTHRGKNVDSLKYPGKMPIGWFRAKQSVDISYLEEQLKPALDFSKKWNVPVWCGEFGAFNNTSDNSTERWYQDVIMLFEQNTIPWIMWRWMPEAMDICESWKRYWQAPVL